MTTLTYSEVYSRAWNDMKNNLAFIAALSFVYCVGLAALVKIPFLGFVGTTLLTSGYYYCLLQIKKGKTLDYKDFFWGFLDLNRAIKLIILGVVLGIGSLIGFIFLVIPGIWFMVASGFSTIIFVMKNPDPFEALKDSLKMVKGLWWYYFGLMAIALVVSFIGLCSFVIGLFVSMPLVCFAYIEVTEHYYGSNSPTGPDAAEPAPIA